MDEHRTCDPSRHGQGQVGQEGPLASLVVSNESDAQSGLRGAGHGDDLAPLVVDGELTGDVGDPPAQYMLPLQIEQRSVEMRGPLPAASEFAGYERVLPGAADRILAMAEREQAHLIEVRALRARAYVKAVEAESERCERLDTATAATIQRAQWMAFLFLIGMLAVSWWRSSKVSSLRRFWSQLLASVALSRCSSASSAVHVEPRMTKSHQ